MNTVILATTDPNTSICFVKAVDEEKNELIRPIMLCASLDTSGSMNSKTGQIKDGEDCTRWKVVAGCLQQAIDYRLSNGNPEDILLIIGFNTKATVLFGPVKLNSWTSDNLAQLMSVTPDNYTNISSGDILLGNEIIKYLSSVSDDTKPIVVTINLTDGNPTTGLRTPKQIAAVKNRYTQQLVTAGYLTVNGFYSIGQGACPDISMKCAQNDNASLWKHVKTDNDFCEFSGEMGLLTWLCQNVIRSELNGEEHVVLKGNWCPVKLTNPVEALIVPVGSFGTFLGDLFGKYSDETSLDRVVLENVKRLLNAEEQIPVEEASSVETQLYKQCATFCKVFRQLHGAEEYDEIAEVIGRAISKKMENMEVKEDVEVKDTGMLRQMSSASSEAYTMSLEFSKSYKSRYKRKDAGVDSTLARLPLPVPLLRTSISSSSVFVPETQVSQRRVRKRRNVESCSVTQSPSPDLFKPGK